MSERPPEPAPGAAELAEPSWAAGSLGGVGASRRQIAACAAELKPGECAAFLSLLDCADRLHFESFELRKQAWDLYRAATFNPRPGREGPQA